MSEEAFLAVLRWDPQIRGIVIVLTGVTILVGSVYLLLATNIGGRLGFVVAVAGLSGWMTVMGAVWTVFGIGIKGAEPHWRPLEVVTGDLSQSTVEAAQTFPRGWKPMPKGDEALADAQAAAEGALGSPSLGSPFKKAEDYEMGEAYRKGGETWFFTLRHRPHYVALQAKPSSSAPPDVQSKPITTVIMLRDLGNLRAPSFFFTVFSAIVFGVSCYVLHQRDKEAFARQASVT